ncbi:MAG: DUF6510 family protein [Candidatus Limnocylindrales bacterium]
MDDTQDAGAQLMVDGNAAAGLLAALFADDVTAVPGKCADCGALNAIGALRAYVRAPGTVLRCPACNGVVLRVVETTEAIYVDARGAAYLRFERR